MLDIGLSVMILVLLLIGSYTDIKHFYVSNRITYSIVLLSIPLITFGNQLIYAQAGFSLFLLAAWHFNQIGAADVKVLIPIIFTLGDFYFLSFLGIMTITGLVLFMSYKKAIPQFIPITVAYLITSVLRFMIL